VSGEGVYWVALGETPQGGRMLSMQQIFPVAQPDARFTEGPNAVTPDEMVAAALAHLARHGAVLGQTPETLLAVPVTAASLDGTELALTGLSAPYRRPAYLVILRGEFDPSPLAPGWGRSGDPEPLTELALVFELGHGAPGSVIALYGSQDGERFGPVLADPGAITDPAEPLAPPTASPDITPGTLAPCHDVWP
jgi:hypothetical protein